MCVCVRVPTYLMGYCIDFNYDFFESAPHIVRSKSRKYWVNSTYMPINEFVLMIKLFD